CPRGVSTLASLSRSDLDFVRRSQLLTPQPPVRIRGLMTTLLLIPLDDSVVFPTMDVTLPVDTHDEERVLLVPRHEGEFAKVGTIARVARSVRLPGGAPGAVLEGETRGVAGAAHTSPEGPL